MQRRSLKIVRAIAESVARDEGADLEVAAVMPCKARGAYAEVLVVRRRPEAEPEQLLIGVARDLTELAIRESFTAALRARL